MKPNTKTIRVKSSAHKNWVPTLKNSTPKHPHFELSHQTPLLTTAIVRDRHYSKTSTLQATRTDANPTTTDATTDRYLNWASQAGITSPKVTQAFFGPIRGAKALDNIQPGEIFITVPKTAALVVAPKDRCPCPPDYINVDYYKKAPWFIQMAAQLLYNRSLGSQSPVWGFIEQLPTSIDAPVRWTLEDLNQLQYPELATRVIKQQQDWRKHYQDLQKALLKQGSSLSWEDDFLWAVENVCSRAFSGPYTGSSLTDKVKTAGVVAAAGTALVFIQHIPLEQALNGAIAALVFNIIYDVVLSQKLKWYAMIPVLDACNHSSKIDSDLSFEYFQDAFTVSTTSGTEKGEQVFVSYGQKSNDGFLQYYGFTEVGNPNDTYTFTVPRYSAGGGSDGGKWKVVVNANGTFSGDTLAKARQLVSASSSSALKGQGGGGGGGEEEGVAARELLLKLVEEELRSKPTALADDEHALLTAAHLMSGRIRCATEFRIQKKKLLQKCVDKAKKKINKLKGGRSNN